MIERRRPKYRSDPKMLPRPKMQAYVQSRKALPMTQLVRFVVWKL